MGVGLVEVGEMGMSVRDRVVDVPMHVRLAWGIARRMGVLMMFVVDVRVLGPGAIVAGVSVLSCAYFLFPAQSVARGFLAGGVVRLPKYGFQRVPLPCPLRSSKTMVHSVGSLDGKSFKASVLDGFGDVFDEDVVGVGEIGDGACDSGDAVEGAG